MSVYHFLLKIRDLPLDIWGGEVGQITKKNSSTALTLSLKNKIRAKQKANKLCHRMAAKKIVQHLESKKISEKKKCRPPPQTSNGPSLTL